MFLQFIWMELFLILSNLISEKFLIQNSWSKRIFKGTLYPIHIIQNSYNPIIIQNRILAIVDACWFGIQIILQNSWSKLAQIDFRFKSEHWMLLSQMVLEHYKSSSFPFLCSFVWQRLQLTSIFYILSKNKIVFIFLLMFYLLFIPLYSKVLFRYY